jgi:hypothetical protein
MKKFLLILTFIGRGLCCFAQDDSLSKAVVAPGGHKGLYYQAKPPEEAQKFWPIYNKYNTDMRALRIENRDLPLLIRMKK